MEEAGLSFLEQAWLGRSLPPGAEQALRLAAGSYGKDGEGERFLHQAMALAPGHAAVYIAFYRYHFYRNELPQALPYADLCLGMAGRELGLNPDWRRVRVDEANFGDFAAFGPRFFLFSLKAYGYIKLRLGALEEGREAVAKVMELDPANRVGAAVLMEVIERMGRDDDDE